MILVINAPTRKKIHDKNNKIIFLKEGFNVLYDHIIDNKIKGKCT